MNKRILCYKERHQRKRKLRAIKFSEFPSPIGLTLLLCFLLLISTSSKSQTHNGKDTSRVNKKRLNTLIITSTVGYTGTMIGLNQVWYSNFERQSFAFFNDSKEWKQMDKLGHFYGTYQISSIGSQGLRWSGVAPTKSDKIAALSSFVVVSSIEIFDGFSSGYGASGTDILANALGSGFYLGQQMLWEEIRVHPKFSFHQTSYANLRPSILGSNLAEEVIKDYNGQTYWLSIDTDKFFTFPKWLNIGIGYGAQEMVFAGDGANKTNGHDSYRQYYLGLDFDVTAIKTNSKALKTLLFLVNMIKLPAPTLEVSQGKLKGHLFYF